MAYNDGIKKALENPSIQAIMLLGNDIRLSRNCVRQLLLFMNSDKTIGSIAPVTLAGHSKKIEDYGSSISKHLSMVPFGEGQLLSKNHPEIVFPEAISGGINLSRREFFEEIGLQDENLFMYSDEVDTGLRTRASKYRLAVIKSAKAWHAHINNPQDKKYRGAFSKYLIGRNKIYLARKHLDLWSVLYVICVYTLGSIGKIIIALLAGDLSKARMYSYMSIGSVMGAVGNMKPNRFSSP